MSVYTRLTEVLNTAQEIPFDDSSRIVFFSDCHRGVDSWADEFGKNKSIYSFALQHYFQEGFTYIELGDGDELYENKAFADIRSAHSEIFQRLRDFFLVGRFYLIYGNHDMERADPQVVRDTLFTYTDDQTGQIEPLFDGIQPKEGMVLKHLPSGGRIFLAHGNQGDIMCDQLSKISCFLDRYFWAKLKQFGLDNPTGPAHSHKRRAGQEKKMMAWVEDKHQPSIFAHTHRPYFAKAGEPPYFNDGCCIRPRTITGIEIDQGSIQLVEWTVEASRRGNLRVCRNLQLGPRPIVDLFV